MPKPMVIDVHAHFIPQKLYDEFDGNAGAFPGVRLRNDAEGRRLQFLDGAPTRAIAARLSDLADRRTWMDANGIDHQLVGLWTDAEGYELAPKEGLAWSRYINRCLREALRDEKRFTPLASLPLQDGRLAAEVLEEAIDAGFAGAMIGTSPRGTGGGSLEDADLDPFWQAAARLEAGIFLHPMFACGDPRLADPELVNTVGRVAETTIAMTRFLYSGHLSRFPGLKLVVAHGGGALPYALGRLSRTHELGRGKYADPRKGFEALFFDSCVYDVEALRFLAKQASPERIMLGSDCPMPIQDPEPTRVIEGAYLGDVHRAAMLGGTARRVFRIRPDCWCRP